LEACNCNLVYFFHFPDVLIYESWSITSEKSTIECILSHTPYFRLIAYFIKMVYEKYAVMWCHSGRQKKCTVIKYLLLKGLSHSESHFNCAMPLHKLQSTDGLLNFNEVDSRLKMSTVLGALLTHDPMTMLDQSRTWYRKTGDWVNIRYVADSLKMSYGTTRHIITDILDYHKVCAWWVPQMLTPENKQARLTTSCDNLSPYKSDPAKFLCRYVTMDETLATQFDPETRLQSKAWKHPTSPPAVKFHRIASVGKVMACVLWDSDGVLMNDYLERGQTVTAIYYAALIRKLCAVVKNRRCGNLHQGVLFYHDNAPAHTSAVTMAAIREYGFELLNHPLCSPDLAPFGFHVFRSWKVHFVDRHLRVIQMSSIL